MHISFKSLKRINLLLLPLLFLLAQKTRANVNAIDFSKVNYPKQLQRQIDFLRNNDGLYNHWVHDWGYNIPKSKVIDTLTFLYNELEKLPGKNIEAELLSGDIAHYLYNMEVEDYYQKAVDHYLRAKALAPTDYRVYWFLGNHYALSASQALSIQTYQTAMKYLPQPSAHELFWADYSVACADANMPATARYAAHQSSIVAGKMTYIEEQILGVTKVTLKSPPADTTFEAKDLWSVNGKEGNKLLFCNRFLGARMAIDSTWKVDVAGYQNHIGYIYLGPHMATAKNGKQIGYTILVLMKIPDAGETLQQFLDDFTSKTKSSKNKKPVSLSVGKIKNALGYEMQDPDIYPEIGGGHMYALAIERSQPEFPGMALEAPLELPKEVKNEVSYYTAPVKYNRVKGKIYYYILLDSCEFIHDESLSVFMDFLNGLTIE